jgi:thiol:disulfide interchange protein DsbG
MKMLLPIIAALLLSACAQASPDSLPTSGSGTSNSSAPTARVSTTGQRAPAASIVQRALAANGAEISGSLDAPAGLEGFVARYQGRELPVYALADGKHIVIGTLLDVEGHDLTGPQMQKLAGSGPGEAQWQALASATWFAGGNPDAKRIVYAFEDTRCPYCHRLWKGTQPLLEKGNVQIRTILVGVIAQESLPEAANIPDAEDPAAAWDENEEDFGKNPAPGDASQASLAKMRANTALMQKLGFMGTPDIVWKDAEGRIRAMQGMPRDQQSLEAIFQD